MDSDLLTAGGLWFVDSFRKMFYLMTPAELALDEEDAYPDIMLRSGIPMFFVFIAIELFFAHVVFGNKDNNNKQKHSFRFNDIVVSMILGAFQQGGTLVLELLGLLFDLNAYIFVYDNFPLMDIHPKSAPLAWYLFIMLGRDLGYYMYHRFLHEFHIGWVGHSVHHSGEDYNMATGLRQGVLQPLCSPPFFCWLALLGIPPQAYAGHAQLNTLFMYWIHTDVIGRLPFGLEYIINTPMAHRMHHRTTSCNSNYAGMFIFWDRLFGTYRAEVSKQDNYGLAAQPKSFDPLVMNTQHLQRMWSNIGGKSWWQLLFARRNTTKWTINIDALFYPIPPMQSESEGGKGGYRKVKWDGCRAMSTSVQIFVASMTILTLVGLVGLLIKVRSMPIGTALLTAASGLCGLSALARVCDQYAGEWKPAVVQSYISAILMFYFLLKDQA